MTFWRIWILWRNWEKWHHNKNKPSGWAERAKRERSDSSSRSPFVSVCLFLQNFNPPLHKLHGSKVTCGVNDLACVIQPIRGERTLTAWLFVSRRLNNAHQRKRLVRRGFNPLILFSFLWLIHRYDWQMSQQIRHTLFDQTSAVHVILRKQVDLMIIFISFN